MSTIRDPTRPDDDVPDDDVAVTWWQWALVGVAAAVGAPLRYVIDTLVSDRVGGAFPYGTLVVNVSGCFALGLLTGLGLYHGLSATPRLDLGTGLVGAYTTFSTFSFETVALLEEGEVRLAARNVGLSAVIGTLSATAGLAIAAL
jgi:CrcB protein